MSTTARHGDVMPMSMEPKRMRYAKALPPQTSCLWRAVQANGRGFTARFARHLAREAYGWADTSTDLERGIGKRRTSTHDQQRQNQTHAA